MSAEGLGKCCNKDEYTSKSAGDDGLYKCGCPACCGTRAAQTQQRPIINPQTPVPQISLDGGGGSGGGGGSAGGASPPPTTTVPIVPPPIVVSPPLTTSPPNRPPLTTSPPVPSTTSPPIVAFNPPGVSDWSPPAKPTISSSRGATLATPGLSGTPLAPGYSGPARRIKLPKP